MSRWTRPTVIVSVLFLAVCLGFSCSSSRVRPEPVCFNHPDEVIKGQGFMVVADRRVFAVMAFLNAVGFDDEFGGGRMHPVRVRVRQLVTDSLASHSEKVTFWRRYHETHEFGTYCYQDFALCLSADYPFRQIRADDETGYPETARKLKDFPDILNDFWRTAKLGEVWMQVWPEYAEELRRYDLTRMAQQMAFLWRYLRMPRQDSLTLVNVPNLLDTRYHAIGAHYENYYYTVESPGSHSYGLNIHEYLHSIVNPIVKADRRRVKAAVEEYYEAGKDKPTVEPYREPVCFTYECMVRALDHRLAVLQTDDPAEKKRIEGQAAWETQQGLTLTRPFYDALAEFEQSDQSFDRFFPTMLERLPEYSP
jgi:hypothetical protein